MNVKNRIFNETRSIKTLDLIPKLFLVNHISIKPFSCSFFLLGLKLTNGKSEKTDDKQSSKKMNAITKEQILESIQISLFHIQ